MRRSPGGKMPSRMAWRKASLTISRSGLYASKRMGCKRGTVMVVPPHHVFS